MCIYRAVRKKSGSFHIPIKKNWVSHIPFVEKVGGGGGGLVGANDIPGSADKGGHSARTSVLHVCHI